LFIGLGGTVLLGAGALWGLTRLAFGNSPGNTPSIARGQGAPDFELQSVDGFSRKLSDYRGKAVMINFWASWCTPCKEEIPLLQAAYDQYSGSLVVLGVNAGESEAVVRNYLERVRMTFPVLLDIGDEVSYLYQVRAFPTTLFIDRDGVIKDLHVGLLSQSIMDRYLERLGILE
jgi:thiol-disulfide isomerase/thioredoxin